MFGNNLESDLSHIVSCLFGTAANLHLFVQCTIFILTVLMQNSLRGKRNN